MRWLRALVGPHLVPRPQTRELLSIWTDMTGRWYYTVEQYPYAAADQFVTYGPFDTRQEAELSAAVITCA